MEVAGHLVLYSLADRPVNVALPFQHAALKSAKLDGKPALLIPHPHQAAKETRSQQYDIVLKTAGAHILDVELELPARVAGPSGEFTIYLLPVPSGRLSFELPRGASTVRVNGTEATFRRRPDGGKDWIDLPISVGGDLAIAWQPTQESGSAAPSIESFAKTLLALR